MKKVIIIGAGPAGLTAANELLKDGDYKVKILEETEWILVVIVFFQRMKEF